MHAIVIVALLLSLLAPASALAFCDGIDQISGNCVVGEDEIVIDGEQTLPGSPGSPRHPGTRPGGPGAPGGPATPPVDDDPFANCLDEWDDYIRCFQPPEDGDDEDEAPAIPPVTISDVARFAPTPVRVAGEPDDAGVVGLPSNFVATASEHTVSGSLFGYPVHVRFTPSRYDFHYGDGTVTTTEDGGRSWHDLGQAQFTPTPTSHAYAERGTYTARVDVRYTAAVDFGAGWFPIRGELTSSGGDREIRIYEAHTALVRDTCQQAPRSPGC